MTPTEQVKLLREALLVAVNTVHSDDLHKITAALAATQDAAPQPDLLAVAEKVREACAKASGKGIARANIYAIDLAAIVLAVDVAALLKEVKSC